MLWKALAYKGWLETRWRLLFALGWVGFFLASAYAFGVKGPASAKEFVGSGWLLVASIAIMLAGAGINTQPGLQATKGLHGSTQFTLSLPVSRLHLLAVRAGIGWLEMTGAIGAMCFGLWILFPVLRAETTRTEIFQYALTLVTCVSGPYCVSVLLATFLDDQWRWQGSFIILGALWWLFNKTPLPTSANIFRAMGQGSPPLAHSMPWLTMAFSLELAAILFFAALKVVQWREY